MVDLAKLSQPLDPKLVKKRKEGGRELSYLEGHTVISQANDIFGFDGWSYEVMDVSRIGDADARPIWSAKVRVSAMGIQRSDIGVNIAANSNPGSQETAIKGAVTDALKRALRTFGDQFGNGLYDKEALVDTAKALGAKPMCAEHGIEWTDNPKTKKRGHQLAGSTEYHVEEIA
jgi:DNA repair and recombination protein RAD52